MFNIPKEIMFHPDLSGKSTEEKLEERLKYRSFFSSQQELDLFLRLPLNSDQTRQLYLKTLIAEEQKKENDGESKSDSIDN